MIRTFFITLTFLCSVVSNSQDLSYYLPDSIKYDPAIPKPKDVVFHEVGEWHITHDRLVDYMEAIAAAAPQRVKLERMGFTYEQRPQVLLIITSQENHRRLEEIRMQHLALTDPSRSANISIDDMPIVVWIGHSIHGNESSGSNAALLTAYYLAAAQGRQIDDLLNNVVILFDPSFNPDGLQRFSTWANQHKSKNLVTDPNSREFNEVWPGGRFNHYWFDLNRDWLPAVHVESQNRLKWFQDWMPNILTDHHEQGSNATFFFQPGVPSRVNPLTPARNQELTAMLGRFHGAYLDRIGSLYFTKENYDDFYYGKGSTYPDVQGSIGVLFEQASSRGHAQQTNNGILTFPFTIRNQFVTALSTLEGAKTLRKEFLSYQRDFFRSAITDANSAPTKAYIFGDPRNTHATRLFAEMLLRHKIDVYSLKETFVNDNTRFESGKAFIVPAAQRQHRLIRAIFDRTFEFKDSLFYDITSWTMPLAFGLPYAEVNATRYNANMAGKKIDMDEWAVSAMNFPESNYGYLLEWSEYFAPAALYELLDMGLIVRVATNQFETADGKYNRGTLFIPIQMQMTGKAYVYETLRRVASKYRLPVRSITSGAVLSGSDLGSSRFAVVTRPQIAMLTGAGVNATDAGEVWHLLDQRMNIPASHLETGVFNRVDLAKYNTIIMVGGSYPELNKDKLRAWVQSGGTLILTEEAVTWAAQNGISTVTAKRLRVPVDSTAKLSYVDREQVDGAQQMNGAIFGAEVDLTHPLAYGYSARVIPLFKSNKVFMEKSKNPYATPFFYRDKPLLSGWISKENSDAIRNSAAVIVNTVGSGRVINIADNPNFRAFWLGGSKLFMNAIFFGRLIDAASARAEE